MSDLTTKHMNEEFNFGGEMLTRAAIIRALQKAGGTPAMIDRWFQGAELKEEKQWIEKES